MYIVKNSNLKTLFAFFAVILISFLVSATSLFSEVVQATDNNFRVPTSVNCLASNGFVNTLYKSAYSVANVPGSTVVNVNNNICIGSSVQQKDFFWQIAVKFDGVVKDSTVTATNGNGKNINFISTETATNQHVLYFSIPTDNGASNDSITYFPGAGYGIDMSGKDETTGTGRLCLNPDDKANQITVVAKGNGIPQTETINLCDKYFSDSNGMIELTMGNIPTDEEVASNIKVAEYGRIIGIIGIERPGAVNTKNPVLIAPLIQAGIVLIELTDITDKDNPKVVKTYSGDKTGNSNPAHDWYSLDATGKLIIKDVPKGTYKLKIIYDDCYAVSTDGSMDDPKCEFLLTEAVFDEFQQVKVWPPDDAWITDKNAGIKYFVPTGVLGKDDKATTATCGDGIPGVGWIICPFMWFTTSIVDASYSAVNAMLITPSINMTLDSNNMLYKAWGMMRSFANVAFVIVFMIIIFSQLSSTGVTNYGIKKLLPKLVIAAILVNVSYFLCAIAVDLSNILGVSIKQLFDSIGATFGQPKFSTGAGWTFILAAVVASSGLLFAGLSILLPSLVAAIFAIVTVLLVLTLRQALLIILIVISPLAFVAFLLPNTEKLYKKWQSTFITMLLMFPIIAFVFGGAALASAVIVGSGQGNSKILVQIMGALISVVPLFMIPSLMKTGGQVLGKFAGAVNSNGLTKTLRGKADTAANEQHKRRVTRFNNRAMNNPNKFNIRRSYLQRKTGQKATDQFKESELQLSQTKYISSQMKNEKSALLKNMTKGSSQETIDRARAIGVKDEKKANEDLINNATVLYKSQNGPEVNPKTHATAYEAAVKSGDKIKALAIQSVLKSSGPTGLKALGNSLQKLEEDGSFNNDSVRNAIKSDLLSSGLKSKNAAIDTWSYSDAYAEDLDNYGNIQYNTDGSKKMKGVSLKSLSSGALAAKTFGSLTNAELAGQPTAVLREAQEKGNFVISQERALSMLADKQIISTLDPSPGGALEMYQNAAAGGPAIPLPPPPPSNP